MGIRDWGLGIGKGESDNQFDPYTLTPLHPYTHKLDEIKFIQTI
ncbi:hypothetical protein [Nostoc sp. CMAA1605]|nr:hypothetical protein [Nostoc sp. CMAA1605]